MQLEELSVLDMTLPLLMTGRGEKRNSGDRNILFLDLDADYIGL